MSFGLVCLLEMKNLLLPLGLSQFVILFIFYLTFGFSYCFAVHKTKKLIIPKNIVLVFLPPYSPDQIPAEKM
jgi:membrane protease YdiL (CAAX protease family)